MLRTSTLRWGSSLHQLRPLQPQPALGWLSAARYYKVEGGDIRAGFVLEIKDRLMVVTKATHNRSGRGGAIMQVEMKDLQTGSKAHERIKTSELVERVSLEQRPHQYLYAEGDDLVLMDMETFEQTHVAKELAGDKAAFLEDGMEVAVELHNDQPLGINLPSTLKCVVGNTEVHRKGFTDGGGTKPATLENGIIVNVPLFVSTGEAIIVRTDDNSFVRRADDNE